MDRRLYFTPGSPFARAIRIMLDEIGLVWTPDYANIMDRPEERAIRTPTLQVPTYFEDELVLWDSSLIAEYLLASYGQRRPIEGLSPLAAAIHRVGYQWQDKALLAAIQTLGQSTVLVSQLRWSGTLATDNAHIARNADRVLRLLDWLETQLPDGHGFFPDVLSAQDIFCICHLMFITNRPLDIVWERDRTPKLAQLHDQLALRPSFLCNAIAWWEPGMPT